jgi:DNA polymerase III delta prime subunit
MFIKQNEDKYAPQQIGDIIWGNTESELRIQDIVTGAEMLPSSGKSAILLYGTFGTGKTTLACMLPSAIEHGRTGEELNFPYDFIACQQGFNGPQVMKLIQDVLTKISFNHSGLHYFILDEVDNLTKLAQQSLKSALNTHRGLFVLTTNNVANLDKGLLDRCVLVEMNAAPNSSYSPLIEKIIEGSNVVLNDNELEAIVRGARGSFRNLVHNVERYIRRNRQDPATPTI